MGYGFRAPALLVSAYARRGYIDSTTLDFTSLLKFVEQNWGLKPLADRDRKANSIASAFDFAEGPHAAAFIPAARPGPAKPEPDRGIIYVAYTFAALVACLVIGGVVHVSRLPREAKAEIVS
jgi:phospholipase C